MLKRDDVVPGMVAGIQTFGELIHFHPHIHAIATDGAFTPDGVFLCLPKTSAESLLATWQTKVFELLVAAEKIDRETVDQMRSWAHSGFSVDNSVYLSPGDTSGLERLAEYILRCPFSLARVVRLGDDGSVIYRAEQDHCRRFPGPASADLRGGPRRNFQVFGALDFLAELTQHIPNKGEHLVRYYGWYSHHQRGIRPNVQLFRHRPGYRPLGAGRGTIGPGQPARRFAFHLGHVDQAGLRSRSAGVCEVRRHHEDHQFYRAMSARCCRANSPPLRPLGRTGSHFGHGRAPPNGSRSSPDGPQFVPDPEFLEHEPLSAGRTPRVNCN